MCRRRKLTESYGSVNTSLYAGDGRKRTKITNSVRLTYIWDGSDYLTEYCEEMAASVVYTNFAGQIAVENRGGTVKEYIPDTLGSTVALAGTMSITDTWDYWPYGEVMTRTGSTPTPFTFLGVLGYFKDLLDKLFYVRARHYEPNFGRWLTVDPVWPWQRSYGYSSSNPISLVDIEGLMTVRCPGCTQSECNTIAAALGAILPYICPSGDSANPDGFADCVDKSGCQQPLHGSSPGACLCLLAFASSITIHCDRGCSNARTCAHAWSRSGVTLCVPAAFGKGCGPLKCLLAHELIHICGIEHSKTNDPAWNCVNTNIPSCSKYKLGR